MLVAAAAVSTVGWLTAMVWPRSAARRHLVLAAALAVCLALPAAAAVRYGTGWTTVAVPVDGAPTVRQTAGPTPPAVDLPPAGRPAPPVRVRPAEAARAGSGVRTPLGNVNWPAWWRAAYAVIAAALLLRTTVGLMRVGVLKRRGVPVDEAAECPVLETDVSVPLAAGWGRPAVLLPRGYAAKAGADALADVLAHETAHLRRRDHVVVLLQRLAAAAYWPAVTVHLMNRSLDRAREELCDEAAVRAASRAGRTEEDYGRTLLLVAEWVTGRRSLPAPSVAGGGELERRVKTLMDPTRDRRPACGRSVRVATALAAAAGLVLAGTARTVTAEPPENAAESPALEPVEPAPAIEWTGVPTVAVDEPDLHRGVVYGPDGRPLAGAAVHAASTIELFKLRSYEEALCRTIGSVRAVTDAEGRFEFRAPDLTRESRTDPGRIVRWETLLVATKAGLPPAFLETWGDDRGFREPWHPRRNMPVAVRFAEPATLRGRFVGGDGRPLAGAEVRVTGLMTPVDYDLDKHIPQEEEDELTMFEPIDYREFIPRPRLLPGLTRAATADADGRFTIEGLPKDHIVQLEVRHPDAKTTQLRAAVREMPPVYRRAWPAKTPGELQETPTLYGSGFEFAVPSGQP